MNGENIDKRKRIESKLLILCTFFSLTLHRIIIFNQLRYYQMRININSSVGIFNISRLAMKL